MLTSAGAAAPRNSAALALASVVAACGKHALAGVLCEVRDEAPQPARGHLHSRTRGQHLPGKPTQHEDPTPPPELTLTLKRLDQHPLPGSPPPRTTRYGRYALFAGRGHHRPRKGRRPQGRLWYRGWGVRGDSGALVAPRRPTTRTEQEPPSPSTPRIGSISGSSAVTHLRRCCPRTPQPRTRPLGCGGACPARTRTITPLMNPRISNSHETPEQ